MNLRHSVSGILQAELTSADLTRSLEQLILAGVELRKIRSVDELTARFWIQRKDKRAADKVMEKRGEDLKIIQEYGLRQTMARIIRRPVLCLGILVLWILTMYLPQRVLFISVEGNEVVPTAEILNAAADCGLRFGTVRKADEKPDFSANPPASMGGYQHLRMHGDDLGSGRQPRADRIARAGAVEPGGSL